MAIDFDSYNTRLEDATTKAESGSDIIYNVANGDDTTEVATDSGNVPSIAKFLDDKNAEIDAGVVEFEDDLQAQVDASIAQFEADGDAKIDEFETNGTASITTFQTDSAAAITSFNNQQAAAIAAAGYNVVGSFEDGTTATQLGDAVYYAGDPLDNNANEGFYAWNNTFPKTVTAGTTPFDESGWQLAATGYTKQSGTIQLFGQEIDASISIPTGQHALSINPTINDPAVVTVPLDTQYVILGSTQ
jgi:hypothetical protein